jgi:hypothetical protein
VVCKVAKNPFEKYVHSKLGYLFLPSFDAVHRLFLIICDNWKCNFEREIKARMAAGNWRYYALAKIMKSREISKSTKLKIYRTIIRKMCMVVRDGLCPSIWRRLSEYGKERS